MIFRYLLFSITVSLLSLLVTLLVPLDVPIRDHGITVSPYTEDIDVLEGKLPLSPEKYQELLDLTEKNNLYFEERRKEHLANTAYDAKDGWKKKSIKLLPIVIGIWAVLFYFFYSRYRYKHFYVSLTVPALFTFTPLTPLVGIITVVSVVMAIWFWLEIMKDKPKGEG